MALSPDQTQFYRQTLELNGQIEEELAKVKERLAEPLSSERVAPARGAC